MRTLQGPDGSVASSASLAFTSTLSGASTIAATAGMALAANDIVSLDDDGLAYKVTDAGPFATVLPNQGVDVIAPTTISGAIATSQDTAPAVILSDGTFVVYAERNGTHLRFQRYSRQGAMIRQAEFAYTGSLTGCRFVALSNGNMAFSAIANGNMQHMVLDRNLVPVLALTTIESANGLIGAHHRMIPLSGGGYALSYARLTTPAQIRFAIYSNTGTAVLAPVTAYSSVWGLFHAAISLAQFSGGNVLLVFLFPVDGELVRTAVYSSTGAVVQAATIYAPMGTLLTFPSAVTIGGDTACLAWASSNTGFAGIVNSSGAVVGTTFSIASNAHVPIVGFDGTNFKVLSLNATNLTARMTTFSAAGAAASATTVDNDRSPFGLGAINFLGIEWSYLDGEFLIHWTNQQSGGVHFSRLTRVRDDTSFADVAVLNANSGVQQVHPPLPLMPGVALVTYTGVSGQWSFVVKRWRSAAIQGVALNNATRGADVVVAALAGFLPTNPVVCPLPVAFNHNATSVPGQRGTLFPKGIALRGLTA